VLCSRAPPSGTSRPSSSGRTSSPACWESRSALVSLALVLGGGHASTDETPGAAAAPGANARSAEVLLWIVLYLALAETFGFVLTAGGLLLAHLLRLGTRPRFALPLVLLLVPAAYQLFAVLLRVPLPRGLLGW
jgi:hypothetical protein